MSTLNPCCAVIVPTQRPLLLRWASDLHETLLRAQQQWRAQRRLHAEQRALDGLPAATLRDLGLAERRHEGSTLPRVDWEYGRWH